MQEKSIKINGREIKPIEFNEELNSIRKAEKGRHETFNKVLEANIEGIKTFLKDKYIVELKTDDEYSLNRLDFKNELNEICYRFIFDYVSSKCDYTKPEDISNILKDFIIGLIR